MNTRPPTLRASFLAPEELVVDCFAGGGGTSTGISMELGRDPDIAINHSAEALAMHRVNHPTTTHYQEDVWQVDPVKACGGKPIGLLWLSPDCKHHSRAKGGKPRDKKIRGLAWVAVRWAKSVRPRVICLENVEEFQTWGPLTSDGLPNPKRAGETFRAFVRKLQHYGYEVQWRSLVAADYGTPTTRRRLFMIARCDGQPIVWPEPSHGKGRAPWRPAADIIDWSLPCPSIFSRKKPLADATQRRIFEGLRRYVIESQKPFIMPLTHQGSSGRQRGVNEPAPTITAAHRGELALVDPLVAPSVPFVMNNMTNNVPRTPAEPLSTVLSGNHKFLVTPYIARTAHGDVDKNGKRRGRGQHSASDPLPTVTASRDFGLVAAWLTKFYSTNVGSDVRNPMPTVTASGRGGGHLAEVRAFLVGYYSEGGSRQQSLRDPLHTITSKARFGLVTVHGVEYEIVDIGMRMLSPRELFGAQGFSQAYVIDPEFNGKPLTKTAQISCAGNSVPPQLAAAIVGAQFGTRKTVAA